MSSGSQLDDLRARFGREIGEVRLSKAVGQVESVTGLLVGASVPDTCLGEVCEIEELRGGGTITAEVVGFRLGQTLLMAMGNLDGIGRGSRVTATGHCLCAPVGEELRGRVLDGLGRPIDGAPLQPERFEPIVRETPHPLRRKRIETRLPVSVKAIDAMLPCGEGQRMGIFASAGGGKSTLMGMIARYAPDVLKVIVLIGERGREVLEFKQDNLGDALKNSVLVVATADQPAVVRMKSAYIGMTIAEYFRDRGERVILMMDSVTRFARALREIGLARGEPPARYGFPPSVFAELPRLFERCGNAEGEGSLTGFFTVLVEGDDLNEPVADETRSLLDGHIVLSPRVPYFPKIDLLASESRLRSSLKLPPDISNAYHTVRAFLQNYGDKEQALEFGALDKNEAAALRSRMDLVRSFFGQDDKSSVDWEEVSAKEFVELSRKLVEPER